MEPQFDLIKDKSLRIIIEQYYTSSGQNFGSKNIPDKVDSIRDIIIQKLIEIILEHQGSVNPKILAVMIMSMREIIYCVVKGITNAITSRAFQIRIRSILAEVAASTFNCPKCKDELCYCNWRSSDLFCLSCDHKIEVKSTYSVLSENPIRLGDIEGVQLFKKDRGTFIIFSYNKNPIFLDVNDWDFETFGQDTQPYLKIIKETDIKVHIPDFDKEFLSIILKDFFDFVMSLDILPIAEELRNKNFTREDIPLSIFEKSVDLAYFEFKHMCKINKTYSCTFDKNPYIKNYKHYKPGQKSVPKCDNIWVRGLSV